MLKIKVIGCGDAFGSEGTHQTCFWIESADSNYLLDCGASSISNIKKYNRDIRSIRAIFISHLHGDHYAGLPFILTELAFSKSNLKDKLNIIGPCGIASKVEQLQELLYPGSWERVKKLIEITEHADRNPQEIPKVDYIRVPHSENLECFALKIWIEDKCIAFSGDMEWSDKVMELCQGSDLFICECFSFDEKIQGHISYSEIKSNLESLNCNRIVLTHLGESMLNNLNNIDIHCLKEGEEILL